MLVLARKVGESIFIGDDVEIKINFINGDTVSLAINAPIQVKVLRKELKERKKNANPKVS